VVKVCIHVGYINYNKWEYNALLSVTASTCRPIAYVQHVMFHNERHRFRCRLYIGPSIKFRGYFLVFYAKMYAVISIEDLHA